MANKPKHTKGAGNFFRGSVLALLLIALRSSAGNMTLAWTPSTNPAVAGFKIYYGPASRVYTNALAVGNVSSLAVSGLVDGGKYFIAVTSCDATGAESAFSDEIVYSAPLPVVANGKSTPPATAKPAAGMGQSASASGSDTLANNQSVPAKNSTALASSLSTATAKVAPSPSTSQNVAKAKATPVSKPVASTGAKPSPVSSMPSVAVQAKPPVSISETPAPVVSAPTLAETVTARAAQFYAVVSPYNLLADGRLDAAEQTALADALLNDALPVIGVKAGSVTTASEASEVVLWIAALHQQIARFDFNRDGKLSANEQSALVATLMANSRLLPLFAPLMLDQ